MKIVDNITKIISLMLIALISCDKPSETSSKYWMGERIDFAQLTERTHTYHMLDSTGNKVGSMIFGWEFRNGTLVARDTSMFDDGSVYETANIIMDTSTFDLQSIAINMKLQSVTLNVDLKKERGRIIGTHVVARDTARRVTDVDSIYNHDVFREEIYMMLHSLELSSQDTITLKPFLATGLTSTDAIIFSSGVETVEVPAGTFKCDVVWIKSEGQMPSNQIWISQKKPRRIIKFYVPGPELSIELIESKKSKF